MAVCIVVRPCTIWMKSGIRKLTAGPRAPMTSKQTMVARSLGDSSTSSDSRGIRPVSTLRCDQAKNAWNSSRPKTRNNSAGERPRTLNGALLLANTIPHVLRLLKPKLIRMTAIADRATPTASILTPLWRGTGLSRKLSRNTKMDTKASTPNE